jgi:GT2 family glycosyltransferase
MEENGLPDISVCMVSLNSWEVLKPCLESLRKSKGPVSCEVILVDNASKDNTPSEVRALFPSVRIIENRSNVGFTKATNQAIMESTGRYLLWLNTDTILQPDSIYQLWMFLQSHMEAGIVGPKVLNGDRSFQPQCRRGKPTVAASMAYFSRFYRLFPKSRWLGEYLLSYLPVDQAAQVVSVSGCCLLARREVWATIGPLDEEIFGFGEDIEWCYRARQAGWQVWYFPKSEIIHLKGQGGVHTNPLRKEWGIHQAMWVFFKKHLRKEYCWGVGGMVWAAIWTKFLISFTLSAMRRGLKW